MWWWFHPYNYSLIKLLLELFIEILVNMVYDVVHSATNNFAPYLRLLFIFAWQCDFALLHTNIAYFIKYIILHCCTSPWLIVSCPTRGYWLYNSFMEHRIIIYKYCLFHLIYNFTSSHESWLILSCPNHDKWLCSLFPLYLQTYTSIME